MDKCCTLIIRGQVQKQYSTELFTFRKITYIGWSRILAGCTGDTPAAYGSVQANLTKSPNMVRSLFSSKESKLFV
jgi:hypothetical protein